MNFGSCNFGLKSYLWFQIELTLRARSILKSCHCVWFRTKLHSTQFNYHYELDDTKICYQLIITITNSYKSKSLICRKAFTCSSHFNIIIKNSKQSPKTKPPQEILQSVSWIGCYRDCNHCCGWWIQWRGHKLIGSCNCPITSVRLLLLLLLFLSKILIIIINNTYQSKVPNPPPQNKAT